MDLTGQTTLSDPKERPHESNSRVFWIWEWNFHPRKDMNIQTLKFRYLEVDRGPLPIYHWNCSCSFCSKRLSQSPNNDVQQNNTKQPYFHNWNLGTLAEAFKRAPKRPTGVGHHCHGSLCGCLDDIPVGGDLG